MIRLFSALALSLLLASCAERMHWSERAAQDRIMLVREEPPTLGFRRLAFQSGSHPDLSKFLSNKGRPDFIAETSTDDRQYLILYYLGPEKAYACRSWRGQPNTIEFAGPYPITSKEADVLRELKRTSADSADTGIAAGRVLIP